MLNHITLNDGKESISVDGLTKMVNDAKLKVVAFFDHRKATERYVIVSTRAADGVKEWYLPYYYRRTNTRVDTVKELVAFIKNAVPCLSGNSIDAYKKELRSKARQIVGRGSSVTYPIFMRLLDRCGKWVWNKDFDNPNPQRRIQDIKEMGFTLATKIENRKTYHMLLPFPIVRAPTYEKMPTKVRKAIFAALEGIDAYSGRQASLSALPDHKFPEIRWEEGTPESNDALTPEMMREKFQLVPESVNQMKREVCRKCFQSGNRGKLNGIDFYYHWGEKWPSGVPVTGAAAKVGCVGCFWYDMAEWRKELNEFIRKNK